MPRQSAHIWTSSSSARDHMARNREREREKDPSTSFSGGRERERDPSTSFSVHSFIPYQPINNVCCWVPNGSPKWPTCAQHACCAQSEPSNCASNDLDLISTINNQESFIVGIKSESSNAQSDGSDCAQQAPQFSKMVVESPQQTFTPMGAMEYHTNSDSVGHF